MTPADAPPRTPAKDVLVQVALRHDRHLFWRFRRLAQVRVQLFLYERDNWGTERWAEEEGDRDPRRWWGDDAVRRGGVEGGGEALTVEQFSQSGGEKLL